MIELLKDKEPVIIKDDNNNEHTLYLAKELLPNACAGCAAKYLVTRCSEDLTCEGTILVPGEKTDPEDLELIIDGSLSLVDACLQTKMMAEKIRDNR